jgi:hypothetical protein
MNASLLTLFLFCSHLHHFPQVPEVCFIKSHKYLPIKKLKKKSAYLTLNPISETRYEYGVPMTIPWDTKDYSPYVVKNFKYVFCTRYANDDTMGHERLLAIRCKKN